MSHYISPYTSIYEVKHKGTCVYSYLTRQALYFPSATKAEVQDMLLQQGTVDQLVSLKFLSDNGHSHFQQYLELYNRNNHRMDSLDVVLHLNYDCNLACPYCYQRCIKHKNKLTHEYLKEILEFLLVTSHKHPETQGIYLTLIGGEPTYHPTLLKELSHLLETSDITVLGGEIVSNGFDLSLDLVNDVNNIGVKTWFVTLDGAKENTDRLRYNPNGTGSFEHIAANLKMLNDLPDISVMVNMNLSAQNFRDVEPLCSWLRSWDYLGNLCFSWVFQEKGKTFTEVLEKKNQSSYQFAPALVYTRTKLMDFGVLERA